MASGFTYEIKTLADLQAAQQFRAELKEEAAALAQVGQANDAVVEKIKAVDAAIAAHTQSTSEATKATDAVASSTKRATDATEKNTAQTGKATSAAKDFKDGLRGIAFEVPAVGRVLGLLSSPISMGFAVASVALGAFIQQVREYKALITDDTTFADFAAKAKASMADIDEAGQAAATAFQRSLQAIKTESQIISEASSEVVQALDAQLERTNTLIEAQKKGALLAVERSSMTDAEKAIARARIEDDTATRRSEAQAARDAELLKEKQAELDQLKSRQSSAQAALATLEDEQNRPRPAQDLYEGGDLSGQMEILGQLKDKLKTEQDAYNADLARQRKGGEGGSNFGGMLAGMFMNDARQAKIAELEASVAAQMAIVNAARAEATRTGEENRKRADEIEALRGELKDLAARVPASQHSLQSLRSRVQADTATRNAVDAIDRAARGADLADAEGNRAKELAGELAALKKLLGENPAAMFKTSQLPATAQGSFDRDTISRGELLAHFRRAHGEYLGLTGTDEPRRPQPTTAEQEQQIADARRMLARFPGAQRFTRDEVPPLLLPDEEGDGFVTRSQITSGINRVQGGVGFRPTRQGPQLDSSRPALTESQINQAGVGAAQAVDRMGAAFTAALERVTSMAIQQERRLQAVESRQRIGDAQLHNARSR